ncbi:glycerol kinase [Vibrio vulnificus]|uniref:glycerol kinase n=1 Tax=Vibrio vulnificus TaxID=672 RepID=UPI000BA036D0|nr:glycerol kinase [Vibrio vulnificus]EGR8988842.1 glycerol kinase [Vibrio vulnificus]MCA0784274.1 glycerol kinase [Vibrio vulnificus]OZS52492.1 glycerol kinase [Vibrio vulnificus]OZS57131.1 glycerol kinase [Vibrio vulnificus]OZS61503.1 glycerol kinase [Vibrio vulnificus]
MTDKISTTALAKMRNIEASQLFTDLSRAGYISRVGDKWILTELGARFGGEYVDHTKFGQFIVWPVNLHVELTSTQGKLLSATQIGELLGLNAKKMNQLLSEMGWMAKTEHGWEVTESGIRAGGKQKGDGEEKPYYLLWHDSITRNKRLKQSVVEFLGQDAEVHATDKSFSSFRQKFEAKHRTLDGHYVRSKGELLIDNWLYLAGVAHAYGRQLPIEEEIISDFYLPAGKVYVQFWGRDNGGTPEANKAKIRAVYQAHHFHLIEVEQDELESLDEVLPQRLRPFGIKAY